LDASATNSRGTDVMIFKIFSPKNAKIFAFIAQTTYVLLVFTKFYHNIEKNTIFSPKIVNITALMFSRTQEK
jgi:hypothetical protein